MSPSRRAGTLLPSVGASAGSAQWRGQESPSKPHYPPGGGAAPGGWERAQRPDGMRASGSGAQLGGAAAEGRPPTAGRPPPPTGQVVRRLFQYLQPTAILHHHARAIRSGPTLSSTTTQHAN